MQNFRWIIPNIYKDSAMIFDRLSSIFRYFILKVPIKSHSSVGRTSQRHHNIIPYLPMDSEQFSYDCRQCLSVCRCILGGQRQ